MFKPQAVIFLKKTLGEEGFEALNKYELYKKKTNTAISPEEIRTALQIVPRAILTFLSKELGQMEEDENKEIKIPIEPEAFLSVTKFANDVYSGDVRQKGKIVSSFRYRSLPGVGLVIMSAFELYDIDNLNHMGEISSKNADYEKVQRLIEDRFQMQDIVSKIVDQKLSERQALDQMIRIRLTQMLEESMEEKSSEKTMEQKKPLKLKQFLEKKSKKAAPFQVKIEKSETVSCPDCGQKIFDQSGFSGCVCFGEDRNKKIHIKKTENGVELSFSKTWDEENIQMLLEVFRAKGGSKK